MKAIIILMCAAMLLIAAGCTQAVSPGAGNPEPAGVSPDVTVPYTITSGGSTPEGVIYTYFNSLFTGDVGTWLESSFDYAMRGKDEQAKYLEAAMAAPNLRPMKGGGCLRLENITVTARERLPVCGSFDSTAQYLCQNGVTDVYRFSIEVEVAGTGPAAGTHETYSYNVMTLLHNGVWKFKG
jgi:hypothetical protein